jgi:hypothetical protein
MSIAATEDQLQYVAGETNPSLRDTINVDERPFDLTGFTVRFRMRDERDTVTLIDNAAAIEDITGGKVRYDWDVGDLTQKGWFKGWWSVTEANTGHVQDTPEFLIIVSDHGPGEGVRTGAIAQRIRGFLPLTYAALIDDVRFGEREMQDVVEEVKTRVLGTANYKDAEHEVEYGPVVGAYLAKSATVTLIPAGVDFWMNQHIASRTGGSGNENSQYTDRANTLFKLGDRLAKELEADFANVVGMITIVQRRRISLPRVSREDVPFISEDPALWGPPGWPSQSYIAWRNRQTGSPGWPRYDGFFTRGGVIGA